MNDVGPSSERYALMSASSVSMAGVEDVATGRAVSDHAILTCTTRCAVASG